MAEKDIKTICILAGEASGDLHAAELIESLQAINPQVKLFGMGGDKMAALGVDLLFHVRELSILGFWEVVKHLPFIRRVFKTMKAEVRNRRPDLVIFVDYPGFNLRFAKMVKAMGFATCFYISPQVWAWGKKRIRQIARRIDRLLVILPFEKAIYEKTGMDVHFVGNPLKDVVRSELDRESFCRQNHLDEKRPILALLPGSRRQELITLLPEMTAAGRLLQNRVPGLQVCIAAAPTMDDEAYACCLDEDMRLIRQQTYDLVTHAQAALVASGTATLETAILGTPMAICYKMSPFTYFLGKKLVKIKNIGLANIVAGRTVAPELIQHDATAEIMAETVLPYLTDSDAARIVARDLKEISEKLGPPGASERAAQLINEMLAV